MAEAITVTAGAPAEETVRKNPNRNAVLLAAATWCVLRAEDAAPNECGSIPAPAMDPERPR